MRLFGLTIILLIPGCYYRQEVKYVPQDKGFITYEMGKLHIRLPGDGWEIEKTNIGYSCSLKTQVRVGQIPDIKYVEKTIAFQIAVGEQPIRCSCGGFVGMIEKQISGRQYTYFVFPDRKNGGYMIGSMKGDLDDGFHIDSHDLSDSGIGEMVSIMIFESITLK